MPHAMARIPKDSFWCSASPSTLFDTVSHCLCVCEAGQSVDSHSLKDLQGFSCVCPPISRSVHRDYRYVLLHASLPEFQGSELSLSLLHKYFIHSVISRVLALCNTTKAELACTHPDSTPQKVQEHLHGPPKVLDKRTDT